MEKIGELETGLQAPSELISLIPLISLTFPYGTTSNKLDGPEAKVQTQCQSKSAP